MKEDEMSEKCVHEWYYRIVDIVSWQFFCIRCGEKLSMDKFSDHASDLEKNANALNARIAKLEAEVQESESASCKFCGSSKSDRRMNSIVCSNCGRKIGNVAPPEVQA